VRLAFAVAAHLEPEILIVDEVLAVGDAAFQKKCLGRMKEVAGDGRTVLFVSHNMDAIQKLCNKGILLEKGKLILQGEINSVTNKYLETFKEGQIHFDFEIPSEEIAGYATRLQIENERGQAVNEIPIGEHFQVRIFFKMKRKVDDFVIALGISSLLDQPIRTTWSKPDTVGEGEYEAVFLNDGMHLADGQYKLVVGLSSQGRVIQYIENGGILAVSEVSALTDDVRIINTKSGLIINQMNVEIIKK